MTLIENHFPRSIESQLRPTVARANEQHPEGESTPRALVTLIHNSDRRSVEAALQRIGYVVRSTNDHAAADIKIAKSTPSMV